MATNPVAVRVALVAGEESGDILGAGLMLELKTLYPQISFVGIGGQRMITLGLESKYPLDRLSVMGLIEPLKRLPELLKIRSGLAKLFLAEKVDLFIGIDSPDFNLGLARKLKRGGVKTAHYVSPSVWAWRQGRIKSIRKSIDLMLTLLPFEAQFYRDHQVPVKYVGHPLATDIQADLDRREARARLDIDLDKPILALLPGSRTGEIKHLMPVYLETIDLLRKNRPDLQFVFAGLNGDKAEQIRASFGEKEFDVVTANTLDLLVASDLVLAASGTTTLEIMLVNRPMVVAYRTDWLSYKIIGSMVKVPYVSLPNLISGKALVPELIQGRATAENLAIELQSILDNSEICNIQQTAFADMRQQLELPSSRLAAKSIAALLDPIGAQT
jgi:lipid-A-disaccharide synthase